MRARAATADMGEAISMEDALSMLTVIFVLFVVFLVPLVTIDRMRLEAERPDPFWGNVTASLEKGLSDMIAAREYMLAFDLEDARSVRVASVDAGNVRYVEALLRDSSITVIRHDRTDNSFGALYCQDLGSTQVFRSGTLTWNPTSRRWVVFDFEIDYGEAESSRAMAQDYRRWFSLRTEAEESHS